MYKVIIIDDEQWIRFLIKDLIPWDTLGLRFCGEADNGIKGLELFKKTSPEIILLDIRMPGLDGISLLKQIKEVNLEACVILISGYRDFEYARSALNYEAFNYLLKPVNEDDLVSILKAATAFLDKNKKYHQKIDRMQAIIQKITAKGENAEPEDSAGENGDSLVQKALNYIDSNFHRQISLESVASCLFVNPCYLSDLFSKEMGKPFIQYVNELRINKAKAMLEKTEYKISDISLLVGFTDTNYFSKVFRKYVGTVPSVYKDSLMQKRRKSL